jgi:hypothetical protein
MVEETKKPKLEVVGEPGEVLTPIPKPADFSLDKFKSKRAVALTGIETLLTALPHHGIAQAKDFARLHPDEAAYWSAGLCFVNVPIKGQKRDTLHLIDEAVALRHIHPAKIRRFRLALASKPNDVFFLCEVPSRNQDNTWVASNLDACGQAKQLWTQAISQKEQGIEAYKVDNAIDPDAFPDPKWPKQSLNELVLKTFAGRIIETDDHPGLARLVGAKPTVS